MTSGKNGNSWLFLNLEKCNGSKYKSNHNFLEFGIPSVTIEVALRRDIFSIIMVTYLPTILMNTINQATVYIK